MDQPPASSWARNGPAWLPAVLAAALALGLYAVTLGGSYVYDDTIIQHPDEDPRFTNPALWSQFWTRDYMPGAVDKLYRPLTCMTFAVQYWMHGQKPWLYHLGNWLLHAGAAAAVAELARRLMGVRVALGAGVLFAVHPVHVEAVAGLVGRAELLCTLAIVGALILFLRPMTFWRALAIVICLAIAILSKEQGILLPAILLTAIPLRKWQLSKIPLTSDKMKAERGVIGCLTAAICLITAGYLVFREHLLGFGWDRSELDWAANPLIRSTRTDRLLMPLVLLGRYLILLMAPLRLSLDYGAHVIGWTVDWRQPYVYLGAMTGVIWLVATAWAIRRRQWAVLFCLAALALSYGIISNAGLLIGTIFGERLMYLPSVFFLILLAALLSRLFRPAMFSVVIIVLAMLGSVRAFTYARLWNAPLQLYLADLADHPQSMHLHGLAVYQYFAIGDYRAAREVAEDCRLRLPDCWQSYQMCVAADVKLHDFADAEAVLAHADRRVSGIRIARLRRELEAVRVKQ